MIAEALSFIVEMIHKGDVPQRIIPEDRRAAHFVVGGELHDIPLSVPPRDHAVGTLAEIVSIANRFAESQPAGGPVVWYSEDAVTLILDDQGHRVERVTLPLKTSDVFDRVVALRKVGPMDQKAFIRLLRVELARAMDDRILLLPVRKLRFENGVTTTSEVASRRESLGREITSKVEAGGELPEQVTLAVRVYKTSGETDKYPIECAVEVEPSLGQLRLTPLPDEIERVRHEALSSIASRLAAGLDPSVPSYYGQP